MPEFFQLILSQGYALSALEACAVLLAATYLVLAVRENILCWYCAFFSTAIYIHLFWQVSLLMESLLNAYYLAMAVYGWYQWKYGGSAHDGIVINQLGIKKNIPIILFIILLTIVSGALLEQNTDAAWPYVDSFTTWGSIVTTIMVTRKILENWFYWLVIDAVSIPLYLDRGLYLTAVLFAVYLVIVVFGYLNWSKQYQQRQQSLLG